MVADSWSELRRQRREESRILTEARRAVGYSNLAPDLLIADRAARVAAYAEQVETAGRITDWLPAAAAVAIRPRRDCEAWKRGRQYRWF